jgi:hypothetical protein
MYVLEPIPQPGARRAAAREFADSSGVPQDGIEQLRGLIRTATKAPERSLTLAYLLWFFFGLFGVHQFYLRRPRKGVAYLSTLAFLTVGLWIDLFTLPRQIREANERDRPGIAPRQPTQPTWPPSGGPLL